MPNSSRKCFTAGFDCGSSKLAAITSMIFLYYGIWEGQLGDIPSYMQLFAAVQETPA